MGKQSEPSRARSKLTHLPVIGSIARMDPWWWLVVIVVGLIIVLVTARADPFWDILLFVRDGIIVTVVITVTAFLLVLIVGMFGGLGRLSQKPIIYGLSSLYVEVVRGIPLLVQLIWWYFAFPTVIQQIGRWLNFAALANYQANAIVTAIVGLVVCYGAYMSEIYRAGIQSIPKGQTEASRSLGMTRFQSMRHVILPQAIRVILPPVGNEFIALLKDSSLVSVVAVADLTRRGREFMATHFNPIEVWTLIALLYLVMTLFSARMVTRVEKKTHYER
ncbi:MAG: amino acid ABC transporter permease [Dehalococcoidales bacterium]|nr:MAG: amino acid ABC transporter permease [Dehalococcoidales bacterium]